MIYRQESQSFSIALSPFWTLFSNQSKISHYLARVYIENKSYEEVIKRFDKPDTFFYLDPPYYGCESYYGDGIFSRDDFRKLSGIIQGIKEKFILSINDRQEIHEIFKGLKMAKIKTKYAAGAWSGKTKAVTELLISNY